MEAKLGVVLCCKKSQSFILNSLTNTISSGGNHVKSVRYSAKLPTVVVVDGSLFASVNIPYKGALLDTDLMCSRFFIAVSDGIIKALDGSSEENIHHLMTAADTKNGFLLP